jgi:hypothetical protein
MIFVWVIDPRSGLQSYVYIADHQFVWVDTILRREWLDGTRLEDDNVSRSAKDLEIYTLLRLNNDLLVWSMLTANRVKLIWWIHVCGSY